MGAVSNRLSGSEPGALRGLFPARLPIPASSITYWSTETRLLASGIQLDVLVFHELGETKLPATTGILSTFLHALLTRINHPHWAV